MDLLPSQDPSYALTGWSNLPQNLSMHAFGVKSQYEDQFSVDHLFDIGQNHAHS